MFTTMCLAARYPGTARVAELVGLTYRRSTSGIGWGLSDRKPAYQDGSLSAVTVGRDDRVAGRQRCGGQGAQQNAS